jgi:hypothetical protein
MGWWTSRRVQSLAEVLESNNIGNEKFERTAAALRDTLDSTAADVLQRYLLDPSRPFYYYRRKSVERALDRLGWKPSDSFQRALFSLADDRYDEAVRDGPAAFGGLLAYLSMGDYENCVHAAEALGQLGNPRALAPIVDFLANLTPNNRLTDAACRRYQERVIYALGGVPGKQTVERLARIVESGKPGWAVPQLWRSGPLRM